MPHLSRPWPKGQQVLSFLGACLLFSACSSNNGGTETDAGTAKDADPAPDAAAPMDASCTAGQATNACDDNFCAIPAGCFLMGSPPDELCRSPDETQHQVQLTHDFLLGRAEVTRAQFNDAMGYDPYGALPDRPVVHVSWHEAAAYSNALSDRDGIADCYECTGTSTTVACTVAAEFRDSIYSCPGYRLPTEAEWEYAYRAGTTTALYNGTLTTTCTVDQGASAIAWLSDNSGGAIHRPRELAANPWGLYDMAGNAIEWVLDRYAPLTADSAIDPFSLPDPAAGDTVVLRSGGWFDYAAAARAAHRFYYDPAQPEFIIGFRVARTLFPESNRPSGSSDGGVPGDHDGGTCARAIIDAPIQPPPQGPRLHVRIPWDDEGDALLLLDTGSPTSFVYLNEFTSDYQDGVGLVRLGCEDFPLGGLAVRYGQRLDNVRVEGSLGNDWFLGAPTVLDIGAATVTRYQRATDIPGLGMDARLTFELIKGYIIANAVIDNTPVRLMVDTGTPLTVWLGQPGRPGDQHIILVDQGNGHTDAYAGSAMVGYAGLPASTETIFRVPTSRFLTALFNYIDANGHIDGILGMASFGTRQVIGGVEPAALRISR